MPPKTAGTVGRPGVPSQLLWQPAQRRPPGGTLRSWDWSPNSPCLSEVPCPARPALASDPALGARSGRERVGPGVLGAGEGDAPARLELSPQGSQLGVDGALAGLEPEGSLPEAVERAQAQTAAAARGAVVLTAPLRGVASGVTAVVRGQSPTPRREGVRRPPPTCARREAERCSWPAAARAFPLELGKLGAAAQVPSKTGGGDWGFSSWSSTRRPHRLSSFLLNRHRKARRLRGHSP